MMEVGVTNLKTKLAINLLQIWCGTSVSYEHLISGLQKLMVLLTLPNKINLSPHVEASRVFYYTFNSLYAKVAIIQKPVNWFARQMSTLEFNL